MMATSSPICFNSKAIFRNRNNLCFVFIQMFVSLADEWLLGGEREKEKERKREREGKEERETEREKVLERGREH